MKIPLAVDRRVLLHFPISSAGRPRRLPASIKPPNIILLLGDDHGWEETGYKQASPRANPDAHAMTPSGVFARTA